MRLPRLSAGSTGGMHFIEVSSVSFSSFSCSQEGMYTDCGILDIFQALPEPDSLVGEPHTF